jgi:hypothetical protein
MPNLTKGPYLPIYAATPRTNRMTKIGNPGLQLNTQRSQPSNLDNTVVSHKELVAIMRLVLDWVVSIISPEYCFLKC